MEAEAESKSGSGPALDEEVEGLSKPLETQGQARKRKHAEPLMVPAHDPNAEPPKEIQELLVSYRSYIDGSMAKEWITEEGLRKLWKQPPIAELPSLQQSHHALYVLNTCIVTSDHPPVVGKGILAWNLGVPAYALGIELGAGSLSGLPNRPHIQWRGDNIVEKVGEIVHSPEISKLVGQINYYCPQEDWLPGDKCYEDPRLEENLTKALAGGSPDPKARWNSIRGHQINIWYRGAYSRHVGSPIWPGSIGGNIHAAIFEVIGSEPTRFETIYNIHMTGPRTQRQLEQFIISRVKQSTDRHAVKVCGDANMGVHPRHSQRKFPTVTDATWGKGKNRHQGGSYIDLIIGPDAKNQPEMGQLILSPTPSWVKLPEVEQSPSEGKQENNDAQQLRGCLRLGPGLTPEECEFSEQAIAAELKNRKLISKDVLIREAYVLHKPDLVYLQAFIDLNLPPAPDNEVLNALGAFFDKKGFIVKCNLNEKFLEIGLCYEPYNKQEAIEKFREKLVACIKQFQPSKAKKEEKEKNSVNTEIRNKFGEVSFVEKESSCNISLEFGDLTFKKLFDGMYTENEDGTYEVAATKKIIMYRLAWYVKNPISEMLFEPEGDMEIIPLFPEGKEPKYHISFACSEKDFLTLRAKSKLFDGLTHVVEDNKIILIVDAKENSPAVGIRTKNIRSALREYAREICELKLTGLNDVYLHNTNMAPCEWIPSLSENNGMDVFVAPTAFIWHLQSEAKKQSMKLEVKPYSRMPYPRASLLIPSQIRAQFLALLTSCSPTLVGENIFSSLAEEKIIRKENVLLYENVFDLSHHSNQKIHVLKIKTFDNSELISALQANIVKFDIQIIRHEFTKTLHLIIPQGVDHRELLEALQAGLKEFNEKEQRRKLREANPLSLRGVYNAKYHENRDKGVDVELTVGNGAQEILAYVAAHTPGMRVRPSNRDFTLTFPLLSFSKLEGFFILHAFLDENRSKPLTAQALIEGIQLEEMRKKGIVQKKEEKLAPVSKELLDSYRNKISEALGYFLAEHLGPQKGLQVLGYILGKNGGPAKELLDFLGQETKKTLEKGWEDLRKQCEASKKLYDSTMRFLTWKSPERQATDLKNALDAKRSSEGLRYILVGSDREKIWALYKQLMPNKEENKKDEKEAKERKEGLPQASPDSSERSEIMLLRSLRQQNPLIDFLFHSDNDDLSFIFAQVCAWNQASDSKAGNIEEVEAQLSGNVNRLCQLFEHRMNLESDTKNQYFLGLYEQLQKNADFRKTLVDEETWLKGEAQKIKIAQLAFVKAIIHLCYGEYTHKPIGFEKASLQQKYNNLLISCGLRVGAIEMELTSPPKSDHKQVAPDPAPPKANQEKLTSEGSASSVSNSGQGSGAGIPEGAMAALRRNFVPAAIGAAAASNARVITASSAQGGEKPQP